MNTIEPIATTTVDSRLTPVSINEFLERTAPKNQVSPSEVGEYLHERLQRQSVQYTSILDAITLFRKFLPASGADADYALLLSDKKLVIGFVWLGSQSYQSALSVNSRQLMRDILSVDAQSIILASTWSVSDSGFSSTRLDEVEEVYRVFDFFGVMLRDWLHIHPEHTDSYMLEQFGERSIGAISDDDLVFCYNHCTFPDQTEKDEDDG